ncbi:hypothetical protein J6A32_10400 [Methanocorpusculum sp.]|nr:hypothetical protein [Methanocorpusculum sp.]
MTLEEVMQQQMAIQQEISQYQMSIFDKEASIAQDKKQIDILQGKLNILRYEFQLNPELEK